MRNLKALAMRVFGTVMAAAFALVSPISAAADSSSTLSIDGEKYTIGSYAGTDPDSNAIWRSVDTFYNTENKYTPSFHTLTGSDGEQYPVFCIQLGSDGPVATSTEGQNYTVKNNTTDSIDSEDIQNSVIARQVSYKVIENGFYSTEYWKNVGLTVTKNGTTRTYTYTDDQVRTATQLAIWISESVVGGGNFYLYYDTAGNCYAPSSIQSAMGTGSDYAKLVASPLTSSEIPSGFSTYIQSGIQRYVYQRATTSKVYLDDTDTVGLNIQTGKMTTYNKSSSKTSYYKNNYDNGMYELVFELAAMGLASTEEKYYNLYGMSKTQVLLDSKIYVEGYTSTDGVKYSSSKPATDIVLNASNSDQVTAINGTPVYDADSVTTSVTAVEKACDTPGYTEIQFTVAGQGFNGGYEGRFTNLPSGSTVYVNGLRVTDLDTSGKFTYYTSTLGSGSNYIHTTRSGVSKGSYSEVVTIQFPTANYTGDISLRVTPHDDRSDDDQIYMTTSVSNGSSGKPQVMVTPSIDQVEMPLGKGTSSDTISVTSNILFGDYSGQFSDYTKKDGSPTNQAPPTTAVSGSTYNSDNYVWLTNSSGTYISNSADDANSGFKQSDTETDLYVNFAVTKNIGYNTLSSVTVQFVAIGLSTDGKYYVLNGEGTCSKGYVSYIDAYHSVALTSVTRKNITLSKDGEIRVGGSDTEAARIRLPKSTDKLFKTIYIYAKIPEETNVNIYNNVSTNIPMTITDKDVIANHKAVGYTDKNANVVHEDSAVYVIDASSDMKFSRTYGIAIGTRTTDKDDDRLDTDGNDLSIWLTDKDGNVITEYPRGEDFYINYVVEKKLGSNAVKPVYVDANVYTGYSKTSFTLLEQTELNTTNDAAPGSSDELKTGKPNTAGELNGGVIVRIKVNTTEAYIKTTAMISNCHVNDTVHAHNNTVYGTNIYIKEDDTAEAIFHAQPVDLKLTNIEMMYLRNGSTTEALKNTSNVFQLDYKFIQFALTAKDGRYIVDTDGVYYISEANEKAQSGMMVYKYSGDAAVFSKIDNMKKEGNWGTAGTLKYQKGQLQNDSTVDTGIYYYTRGKTYTIRYTVERNDDSKLTVPITYVTRTIYAAETDADGNLVKVKDENGNYEIMSEEKVMTGGPITAANSSVYVTETISFDVSCEAIIIEASLGTLLDDSEYNIRGPEDYGLAIGVAKTADVSVVPNIKLLDSKGNEALTDNFLEEVSKGKTTTTAIKEAIINKTNAGKTGNENNYIKLGEKMSLQFEVVNTSAVTQDLASKMADALSTNASLIDPYQESEYIGGSDSWNIYPTIDVCIIDGDSGKALTKDEDNGKNYVTLTSGSSLGKTGTTLITLKDQSFDVGYIRVFVSIDQKHTGNLMNGKIIQSLTI